MSLFLAFVIVAAACSLITIRNLISYSDFSRPIKIGAMVIVFTGWFGVIPLYIIQKYNLLPDMLYGFLYHVLYFMLVFVFILFVCLMLRDLVWFMTFGVFKFFGHSSWRWDPHNEDTLNIANLLAITLSLFICISR